MEEAFDAANVETENDDLENKLFNSVNDDTELMRCRLCVFMRMRMVSLCSPD